MSDYTLSPNMSLPVPNVGTDPSPQWADDVNSCLTLLDGHNHSSGAGVQINPSGIDINTDLPFNSQNATFLRSSRYINNSTTLVAPTDLCCVYASGGNLYYNNSGGTAVQITSGSSVNAGAGSITGLPSGTASVTYASSIYVFQSATVTPATIDVGSVILRNTTASSNGVTLSPVNSLSSNYALTLPTLPADNNTFLTISTAGVIGSGITVDNLTLAISGSNLIVKSAGIGTTQLADSSVTTAKIAANNVTFPKLAARTNTGTSVGVGEIAVSNTSGSLQTTISPTPVAVSNLSVTIATQGGAVYVGLIQDQSGGAGFVGGAGVDGVFFQIYRGATLILQSSLIGAISIPPSSVNTIDYALTAGTYTYSVSFYSNNAGTTSARIAFARLVAYEI